jgi:hypothetical protein
LTGRVEEERVKANISILLNVKLSLFFEWYTGCINDKGFFKQGILFFF